MSVQRGRRPSSRAEVLCNNTSEGKQGMKRYLILLFDPNEWLSLLGQPFRHSKRRGILQVLGGVFKLARFPPAKVADVWLRSLNPLTMGSGWKALLVIRLCLLHSSSTSFRMSVRSKRKTNDSALWCIECTLVAQAKGEVFCPLCSMPVKEMCKLAWCLWQIHLIDDDNEFRNPPLSHSGMVSESLCGNEGFDPGLHC